MGIPSAAQAIYRAGFRGAILSLCGSTANELARNAAAEARLATRKELFSSWIWNEFRSGTGIRHSTDEKFVELADWDYPRGPRGGSP
jgi:hypothetical protein